MLQKKQEKLSKIHSVKYEYIFILEDMSDDILQNQHLLDQTSVSTKCHLCHSYQHTRFKQRCKAPQLLQ